MFERKLRNKLGNFQRNSQGNFQGKSRNRWERLR